MWLALRKDNAVDDRRAGQMIYVNTSGFIFVIFADFSAYIPTVEFRGQRHWFVVNINVKTIGESVIVGITLFFLLPFFF